MKEVTEMAIMRADELTMKVSSKPLSSAAGSSIAAVEAQREASGSSETTCADEAEPLVTGTTTRFW